MLKLNQLTAAADAALFAWEMLDTDASWSAMIAADKALRDFKDANCAWGM